MEDNIKDILERFHKTFDDLHEMDDLYNHYNLKDRKPNLEAFLEKELSLLVEKTRGETIKAIADSKKMPRPNSALWCLDCRKMVGVAHGHAGTGGSGGNGS